jgi:hypothetical protein
VSNHPDGGAVGRWKGAIVPQPVEEPFEVIAREHLNAPLVMMGDPKAK